MLARIWPRTVPSLAREAWSAATVSSVAFGRAVCAGAAGRVPDGIALLVLIAARLVRGRNTRWDVLQPALWILPPLFVPASAALWAVQSGASVALFLASRPWSRR